MVQLSCLAISTFELANPSKPLLLVQSQSLARKSKKIGPHPEVSDTGEVSLGNPAINGIRDQPSSMVQLAMSPVSP